MRKLTILSMLIMLSIFTFGLDAQASTYNYDYFGQVVNAPSAYAYQTEINAEKANINSFVRLIDITVNQGYVYVLDEALGLFVFNDQYEFLYQFSQFENEFGDSDRIRRSSSIAVTDEYVYVADMDSERIAVLSHKDEQGQPMHGLRYVKSIYMPDNIPSMEDIAFKPLKVAVDYSGRIFVINRDVYEGLMEFDIDGNFKQFVGTNEVQVNLIDYFWRQLISREARSRLNLYLPVVFTSLAIDASGFIYTTTESANVNPIQKFNYKGEDILIQNGNIPVKGDLTLGDDKVSTFKSIDINQYGIYIALETSMNRIFAYNDNGELLYIIGNRGRSEETFDFPVSIAWQDDHILVVDQAFGKVIVLHPTQYGEAINQAVQYYFQGDFETSTLYWEEVLTYNSNFDLAYVGIGKVYYQNEQYEEAVSYFRLGNNRIYFSRAYEKYRNEWLRANFTWIFIIGAVLSVGVAISLRRKPE